jgi:type II restriction enzyme|tara:strand:- start:691 stop:1362 length:672 start_codon:yes stop_codon:yes gene_type:complete
MSSSDRLRETHKKIGGGKAIFNEDAKNLEGKLSDTVQEVINYLQGIFPGVKFSWVKKLEKKKIAENIGKPHWKPCSKNPYILPDGGIVYAEIFGKVYPILISEAKKQGTNDKLLEEGKKKQAKGNAIERAVKNHSEISLYCRPYDYYPYVVFASGCDFEASSSINDRLDAMTDYEPRNQEYIFHEDKLATVWIREKQWTNREIYDKLKDTAEKIVYHIISYEQ